MSAAARGAVRAAMPGRDDPSLARARRATPRRVELAASININHALGTARDRSGPLGTGSERGSRDRRPVGTPAVHKTRPLSPPFRRRIQLRHLFITSCAGNAGGRAAAAAARAAYLRAAR